jgi:hypothetical protein
VNLNFRFAEEKSDGIRTGEILLARMEFENLEVRRQRIFDSNVVASHSSCTYFLVNAERL